MGRMDNGHPFRTLALWVLGLIVVGVVAWWVVKALLSLVFYLIVGAVVVGGATYLFRKSTHSLSKAERRRLR
jgi:uncharacterized membrane protein YfcA